MVTGIPAERIRRLNDRPVRSGAYVLYWMQASHRVRENPALQYAIGLANRLHLPVVAGFSLDASYPGANLRNLCFLLEGLTAARTALGQQGIRFVFRYEREDDGIALLARDAAAVVADRGYLRFPGAWYAAVAGACRCLAVQVEGNVVVPVETASGKEEYSAATIRRKLTRLIPRFLTPTPVGEADRSSLDLDIPPSVADSIDGILSGMEIDRSAGPVAGFHGGEGAALARFDRFLVRGLDRFLTDRNDPGKDASSGMSPYLHFGQVSPVTLANRALEQGGRDAPAFLEELIVRRELAVNFVRYNPVYDSFACLPAWAKATLKKHQPDPRPFLYSKSELEQGKTHDRYWNAAQLELKRTGWMHGYLRMYWGKKILEWSATPEEAYATAVSLNDTYELDGRDPNGYAGIAWCFGKHDRPWGERPVFGTVRSMTAAGLERKFSMQRYLKRAGTPV